MPMEYDQLIIKINASTLGLVGQLLDKMVLVDKSQL